MGRSTAASGTLSDQSDDSSLSSSPSKDVHTASSLLRSPSSVLSQDDASSGHFVSSDEAGNFGGSYYGNFLKSTSQMPQLIMPKVALPEIKPFTENGLKLGKLKILLAGDSGVGKTRLIQAIGKSHKDLVFMEDVPIAMDGLKIESLEMTNEIYASTKPYPLFWMNDVKRDETPSGYYLSGRRTSLVDSSMTRSSDSTLDRNICFVDTVGYGQSVEDSIEVESVITYLDNKFRETAGIINIGNPKVLSLLTSASSLSEFSNVDVCLYFILNRIKQVDLDYMARISDYTPIIPIIAKSDLLPKDEIVKIKVEVLKKMKDANIVPFLFDIDLDEAIACGEEKLKEIESRNIVQSSENGENDVHHDGDSHKYSDNESLLHPLLFPCFVSSIESGEPEMLASLLMAADYSAGLIGSELDTLCHFVFSDQGSAWLRYAAAKKFINWSLSIQTTDTLHNRLEYSLVPTANSNASDNFDYSSLVVNLPSSVFANRERAQQQTARWAMQIEQASRTENEFALRANSVASRRNRQLKKSNNVNNSTASPRERLTGSIINRDPLGLKKLSRGIFKVAINAMGVVLGLRIFTYIYSNVLSSQPSAPTATKSSEPLLVSLLNSLGGGWSTLL